MAIFRSNSLSMKTVIPNLILIVFFASFGLMNTAMAQSTDAPLEIMACEDFEISGSGDHPTWQKTSWQIVPCIDEVDVPFSTRFKMQYSTSGIYFLAECEDRKITTKYTEDQDDIWNGDVFEMFFQPDPGNPLYLEYEINPLNTELVLLVPNHKGTFFGWAPWHYEGERRIKKLVRVEGGEMKSGASIEKWTAEVFIPFALFTGLENAPPMPGDIWKANFYRMDYDSGERIKWAWKPIEINFHQYERFGTLVFK